MYRSGVLLIETQVFFTWYFLKRIKRLEFMEGKDANLLREIREGKRMAAERQGELLDRMTSDLNREFVSHTIQKIKRRFRKE